MNSLITTKNALVETLEERYNKYPELEKIPEKTYRMYWGEPGRFENHLGISPVKSEEFGSSAPNIMFSTSEALGYLDLGKRKAHSKIKITRVEPWGNADTIAKLYG